MTEWLIYQGTGEPHDGIARLPDPPPWRSFDGGPLVETRAELDSASTRRLGRREAHVQVQREEELELVNAALYLRRPLLVDGEPGAGKSTLAHSVAHELRLGRVLQWPIVSRTGLRDGLYQYDAIGRLQDVQLSKEHAAEPAVAASTGDPSADRADPSSDIGRYIQLGPLGTALLPTARPRVLLVDELDKSDIDLPNDLLNVLEEGEFEIPELRRIADRQPAVDVLTDDGERVTVHHGRVRCRAFPFVVMTSNGERDFPAPLLRRCIRLGLDAPGRDRLAAMVQAHFGPDASEANDDIINRFLGSSPGEVRAADQLLNAIYLTQHAGSRQTSSRADLADVLMRPLGRPPR